MIWPAPIASPPYTLTPSLFACESRPLRDEPPAFLCAICLPRRDRRRSSDRIDANLGEILPVAGVLLKVLAPAHLEDRHFRMPPLLHDRALHARSGNQRRANTHLRAVAHGEHVAEGD